jgi:integrase
VAVTNLPFTYVVKGKYWRFRRGSLHAALPGAPGDAEFHAKYAELVGLSEPKAPPRRETFEWLIGQYRTSAEFRNLADRTQDDYGQTLDLLVKELGAEPYRYTTRAMIKAVRDDYADTTRKAHKIKQMVSRLYSWADENSYVPEHFNPAKGIKRLKRKGGEREIVVWSDAEIAAFLEHAPPHLKTPVLIALYTGQRKEDVLRMTWLQFQGDIVRVRQSKTSALLDIACHSVLRRHLEGMKREGVVICLRESGEPWNPNAFGAALYRQVRRTPHMPPDRSMHGLRYAAGSTLDEAGATVAEIESVLGHRTFKMALKYASQRLRAKVAVAKMESAG